MERNDKTSGFQHTAFNIRSFDIQFRGMQLFYKVCVLFVSSVLLCSESLSTSRAWGFVVSCHGRKGNTVRAREQEEEEGKKRQNRKGRRGRGRRGRRKEEGRRKKTEKTEKRGEEKDDPSQSSANIHLDRSSKTSSNPASFIQFSMIGTVL